MIADSALDVAAASFAMTTVKAALPLKTCCQFLLLRRGRLFVFTREARGSVAGAKAQNQF
jgi:hypothetical protein